VETSAGIWSGLLGLLHGSTVLNLGALLLAGFLMGKVAEWAKLPAITGYIVAGLALGPSALGVVDDFVAISLKNVTEVALGLIALTIGGEFSFARVRRTGVRIIVLTLFEALLAFVFVAVALRAFGVTISIAMLIGAIAAATAPAATVVIIRELKARGEFIDYLYGVVAFDDAVGVVLFSVIFAFITPAMTGVIITGGVMLGLWHAVSEIALSIGLGVAGGILVHFLIRRRRNRNEILLISAGGLLLVTALAIAGELSSLIADMAMGAVLINMSPRNRTVFEVLEPLSPPIFALFFVIAGTELALSVFATFTVVLLGVVSLVARFLGKYVGIYLGSKLTAAPERVEKYLGFCLVPQAGVAIGLALFVRSSPVMLSASFEAQQYLSFTVDVVLLSVFISQLIGPAVSKFGIRRGVGL
jgi:Kef-type K+ transport system membrane component KefB